MEAEGWSTICPQMPWGPSLPDLPQSSDLSQPQKELYWDLVVGSVLDFLMDWLSWSMEEVRSHWKWVPGLGFLNNSEFLITWRFARNVFAFLSDCPCCPSGLEETAEHAFYYCKWVCLFWDHVKEWTARIKPKQLVLFNIGYVMRQCFASISRWEVCGISRNPSCS